MNWLRHIGVLLANKGLLAYCTLRLLMAAPYLQVQPHFPPPRAEAMRIG